MKAFFSFLFISVSSFAMNMMPPGHSQHEYECSVALPTTAMMGTRMPPKMVMLHHHVGCFGDSIYVNLVEQNGVMSEDMHCARRWGMLTAHGDFFTCDDGNDLFVDYMNGIGTWTIEGMSYAMDCVTIMMDME